MVFLVFITLFIFSQGSQRKGEFTGRKMFFGFAIRFIGPLVESKFLLFSVLLCALCERLVWFIVHVLFLWYFVFSHRVHGGWGEFTGIFEKNLKIRKKFYNFSKKFRLLCVHRHLEHLVFYRVRGVLVSLIL